MAAGFGAYQTVLADPRARAFSLAGFVARTPLSMTSLGIVLLVSATTGSFGRAGLITAVGTVTGAVAAPLWGRLIDRVGQARVLITAGIICSVSMTGIIAGVTLDWPLAPTLVAAVGVGIGFSSAGSCVRARWSYRLHGDTLLLNTAFALEAVIDEVVFIVGPVLTTFLATSIHPAMGLAACALFGLVGALLLGSMRDTEPPRATVRKDDSGATGMPVGVLLPIVIACVCLGALFGAMELVVVAFATEAGIPQDTGFIVMAWAFGSLLAGLVTGTIEWKVSPSRRFRISAVLLACSVLPLPFVDHPLPVTGLLLLSGLFIAPTLIASTAVTQSAVPAARLTESLAWTSTGLATGVAVGAAGSGYLVDLYDARAGFWGVVAIGGLLIIASLCVRAGRTSTVTPAATRPGTA